LLGKEMLLICLLRNLFPKSAEKIDDQLSSDVLSEETVEYAPEKKTKPQKKRRFTSALLSALPWLAVPAAGILGAWLGHRYWPRSSQEPQPASQSEPPQPPRPISDEERKLWEQIVTRRVELEDLPNKLGSMHQTIEKLQQIRDKYSRDVAGILVHVEHEVKDSKGGTYHLTQQVTLDEAIAGCRFFRKLDALTSTPPQTVQQYNEKLNDLLRDYWQGRHFVVGLMNNAQYIYQTVQNRPNVSIQPVYRVNFYIGAQAVHPLEQFDNEIEQTLNGATASFPTSAILSLHRFVGMIDSIAVSRFGRKP
jgi:hypothetical protein